MRKDKTRKNSNLVQMLLNVVIIGIFSIVEKWLIFYYDASWILALIFEVLILLMCCLLTINIYNCVLGIGGSKKKGNVDEGKQIQALLYKQMKQLEGQIPKVVCENSQKALEELENNQNKLIEEIKLNQLRSTKVILDKVNQLEILQDELKQMLEQSSVTIPFASAAATDEPEEFRIEPDIKEEPESFEPEEFRIESVMEEEPESFEPEEFQVESDVKEEPESFEPEEFRIEPDIKEEPESFEPEEFQIESAMEEEPESFEPEEFQIEPDLEEDIDLSATEGSLGEINLDALLEEPNKELTPDEIAALFAGIN